MSIERGRLVYVRWTDPTSSDGWLGKGQVEEFFSEGLTSAESVGWVVREDEESVIIAATITEDDIMTGQAFMIPRAVIKELVPIPTDPSIKRRSD